MAGKPIPNQSAATAATDASRQGDEALRAGGRIREEMDEREVMGGVNYWMMGALTTAPSWLTSFVFHVLLLLVLALWTISGDLDPVLPPLVAAPEPVEDVLEEIEDLQITDLDLEEVVENVTEVDDVVEEIQDDFTITPDEMEPPPIEISLTNLGPEPAPINDLLNTRGTIDGTGVDGRENEKYRNRVLDRWDRKRVTPGAVTAALKWLAEHQMPDGGWSFNHAACPRCNGQCRNPGSAAKARCGATGMALLPFLGAGQTHMDGSYKATVKNGLYFLISSMKVDAKGGSMHESEGNMYSHGLGSIALCEAYAMTHDRGLHGPAQAAINFICYAQAADGGWRYQPKQNGDTSVVGWQIMALKSGHLAYLRVPPLVVTGAERFLDKVQASSGANYGYTSPAEGRHATTSIGLLCRMYLGWKKDNPALQRGCDDISGWGPSNDVYYNYYATQVMRHIEDDRWEKWNNVMRDKLVAEQCKEGHETGSWWLTGGGGHGNDKGGRLYHTAMSTMVLEVYYRYMPIYQSDAADLEFTL